MNPQPREHVVEHHDDAERRVRDDHAEVADVEPRRREEVRVGIAEGDSGLTSGSEGRLTVSFGLVTKDEILAVIEAADIRIPGGMGRVALDFYLDRPNQEIEHDDAVQAIVGGVWRLLNKNCKDPDREIRKLHELGILQKIRKGVYKLDPTAIKSRLNEEFSAETKLAAMKRDGFRCRFCGMGQENGVDLQVDHIKPRKFGGSDDLDNAQVLCGFHHNLKRTQNALLTGRAYFEKMRENAILAGLQDRENAKLVALCDEVLAVYDRHGYLQ